MWLILNIYSSVENLYEEAYSLLKPGICYGDNAHILLMQIDRALTSP